MPENTRGPKIHPADLTAKATEEANLAGMVASAQPWQDDCAGFATAELIDAVVAVSVPVVDAEPVMATTTPVEVVKAKKPAQKKAKK
jgi:hypothetical protein